MNAVATSILEQNLLALSRGSPDLARRLADACPRDDVRFLPTEDGALSVEVGEGSSRRALASRRRPREEARALAESVSIADAAVFLVSGFGAGYHVQALAERLDRTGIVVVFEPDLGLLRAVLERIDCSGWLGARSIAIVDDPGDTAALARLVEGVEALVAMGVTLVEHPASRARIGEATRRLHESFLDIVKAVRMTVVTTMVQVSTTLRNLTQNLDWYAMSPGIGGLAGACRGRSAIVVAAGPSLQRNIALLEDPRVRERSVIIAVQTVLKPLLARGIRPHFVTALDYSEISTRFYEGLAPDDVRGITLVADAKVNPAVLRAWMALGGECRIQADAYLDKLVGPALPPPRDRGRLPAGATVAHLAYYLARHLGCDPVALVGQDLGFTDGQYYSAGAAVHSLWACELNEFNTLEMLEWQRILRMGQHLRRATDILGRPVYTDQQMATYLVQFERDFGADAARGLTTVDATEGGVRKQHTIVSTLAEFIAASSGRAGPAASIEQLLSSAGATAGAAPGADGDARAAMESRVAAIARDARAIAESSRRAESLLVEMIEHHADQPRVNRLIGRLEKVRDEAVALQPAFDLAQTLNQTGVFNRLRADRALKIESTAGGLTPAERQRRQLERDRENVRSLALAADDLAGLLDDCLNMLRTGERVTRPRERSPDPSVGIQPPAAVAAVATVIPVLGHQPHLAESFDGGLNVLEATVARVAGAAETPAEGRRRIVLLADDVDRAAGLLRHRPAGCEIHIVPAPKGSAESRRLQAVRAARVLARDCWRGGIANQSVYDEIFEPAPLRDVARELGLDAILLVGPDWCAVEPGLCDAVIERYRANPGSSRFTFTQAVPGLCGCVLSRALLDDLVEAEARTAAGADRGGVPGRAGGSGGAVFASIGGLLGYIPFTPIVDLINLPECVAVDPALRDRGERLIADTPRGRQRTRRYLAGLPTGSEPEPSDTDRTHLVLHVVAGETGGSLQLMQLRDFARALDRLDPAEQPVVTIRSADPLTDADPLDHPDWQAMVAAARNAGAAVHIRTPLTSAWSDPDVLLAQDAAIISADLHTEAAGARLDRLLARRAGPWSIPWIVPRLTRCDARYQQIDGFFRPRLIQCGWAVLDPLRHARAGERIAPLPVPAAARRRLNRATLTIGVDGQELAP